MNTGIFFPLEVIERDLVRFSQGLADTLNASVSAIFYESSITGNYEFGHRIHTRFNLYEVTMKYDKDELGEFAISDKNLGWNILIGGEIKADGYFPTLQQVMDFINENDKPSTVRAVHTSLFRKVVNLDGQLQDIIDSLDKEKDKDVVEKLVEVYKAFLEAEETIYRVGKIK
jgi:hypothetical protein